MCCRPSHAVSAHPAALRQMPPEAEFRRKASEWSHAPAISPDLGPDARDLLGRMTRVDVTRRLGGGRNAVNQIRAHPFFGGCDWEALLRKEAQGQSRDSGPPPRILPIMYLPAHLHPSHPGPLLMGKLTTDGAAPTTDWPARGTASSFASNMSDMSWPSGASQMSGPATPRGTQARVLGTSRHNPRCARHSSHFGPSLHSPAHRRRPRGAPPAIQLYSASAQRIRCTANDE